jgi:transposase
MLLGFSRHMVARIVFDQKLSTWLQLHVECFEELDGVPHVLVPDNLKAAVIRAAFALGDKCTGPDSSRGLIAIRPALG